MAGERAQSVRVCVTLVEDLCLIPSTGSEGLQPLKLYLSLLDSECLHLCAQTHRHAYIHNKSLVC